MPRVIHKAHNHSLLGIYFMDFKFFANTILICIIILANSSFYSQNQPRNIILMFNTYICIQSKKIRVSLLRHYKDKNYNKESKYQYQYKFMKKYFCRTQLIPQSSTTFMHDKWEKELKRLGIETQKNLHV